MSKSADTRARILDAALSEAPDTGLAGLSIARLAKAAGMSKSGLFARFGDQEALQTAIVQEASARFRRAVVDPARSEAGAAARLKALAKNWTAWQTGLNGAPCPVLQAAFEAPALTPKAADAARQARRDWTAYIQQLARRAALEGGLPEGTDPAAFAFAFEGAGLAVQSYAAIQKRDDAGVLAEAGFARLFG